MAIIVSGSWANADTEAEVPGGTYPDPCTIYAKDTQNTFYYDSTHTPTIYQTKTSAQDKLVSGTNIKTVNGVSLLGSGNIVTGGGGASAISFNATATVAAYLPVTSTGVPGDSTVIAQRGKIIGIATSTVSAGFVGQAVGYGTITNAGWSWTIGDKIFLNGTALSTTAPSTGYSQRIGTATASDTIEVDLGMAILL